MRLKVKTRSEVIMSIARKLARAIRQMGVFDVITGSINAFCDVSWLNAHVKEVCHNGASRIIHLPTDFNSVVEGFDGMRFIAVEGFKEDDRSNLLSMSSEILQTFSFKLLSVLYGLKSLMRGAPKIGPMLKVAVPSSAATLSSVRMPMTTILRSPESPPKRPPG